MLIVGMAVGIAAVVGTLRFLYSWGVKPVIYLSLIPTLALSIYVMSNPFLSNVLGLAWDSGAVSTGPVTVPWCCRWVSAWLLPRARPLRCPVSVS